MMFKKSLSVIGIMFCLVACQAVQGWDHNADWPIATEQALSANPNGVWSYGYLESGDITAFHIYDRFIPNPDPWAGEPALSNWSLNGEWLGPDKYGNNGINTSSGSVYHDDWPGDMYWAAGQTNMMTPDSSVDLYNQSCTRFTAPFAGKFEIHATFINSMYEGNPTHTKIVVNGSQVGAAQIDGFGFTDAGKGLTAYGNHTWNYSATHTLAKDDTVDFVIQYAGVGDGYNQVAFDAEISPVSYDYNADFSISNGNPNGVWTYGNVVKATGQFLPYLTSLYDFPNERWENSAWSEGTGPDNEGCVTQNVSGTRQDWPTWEPGQSWTVDMTGMMSPIDDASIGTGARFTAPAAGIYSVNIMFENRVCGTDYPGTTHRGLPTEVYVRVNAELRMEEQVAGFESGPENFASFAETVSLEAGGTIDFYVGSDRNTSEPHGGGDHLVGVTATISPAASCAGGIYLKGDLNQDCYVNLEDFALLTRDWLRCNDSFDANCAGLP